MLNLLASFLSFVALLLQLLAILGDVSTRISTIYYFRLDLTQSGNSFTTSIEHQLGDPDFVTFGLFGFCEGYYGQGVTFCSPPTIGYDFDPQGALPQLFASMAPTSFHTDISRVVSGIFIPAIVLTFLVLLVSITSRFKRIHSLFTTLLAALAALFTFVTFVILVIVYESMESAVGTIALVQVQSSMGPSVWMTLVAWLALLIVNWLYLIEWCLTRKGKEPKTGSGRWFHNNMGGRNKRAVAVDNV